MSAHKRVLIVDDEEGVRVSFNRYLSQHGFDVTTAEDGEKAISSLQEEAVDVVVADLKMPRVNGMELLEWMHDEQPDTPFILLTGYGNAEVERKVRELGAYEYLNKPISPDALSAVLTAATVLDILPGPTAVVEEEIRAVPEAFEVEPERVEARAMAAPDRGWSGRALRVFETVAGVIVAPLLGLAFVIIVPIIGLGTIVWTFGEKVVTVIRPSVT